jgi:hypothetical protein
MRDMGNAYKFLFENPEGKIPLGRCRSRWWKISSLILNK